MSAALIATGCAMGTAERITSTGVTGAPAASALTTVAASASQAPSFQATPRYVSPPSVIAVTVKGKPQAESRYFHPIPSDDSLYGYASWLEPDEGLPYPHRALDWTSLGGPGRAVIAVGPDGEIYAGSNEGSVPRVARYAQDGQWSWEELPAPEQTEQWAFNGIDVTADGVVWAATSAGLFTRVNGEWHAAPSWDRDAYPAPLGVLTRSADDAVLAFLGFDVLQATGAGSWTRLDRQLPLLSANAAYTRTWRDWGAAAGGWIARADFEVLWIDPQGHAELYPILANDVGIGAAGERLVVGRTALLVSNAANGWDLFPVQLGGSWGGSLMLDQLTVSPAGDAYVSGVDGALFHRFPDGSVEFVEAPESVLSLDANDRTLVVAAHDGVWQSAPRTESETSGVFEAVVPSAYHGKDVLPTSWTLVELVPQFEQPSCFDVDLSSQTGRRVAHLPSGTPPRYLFQAPEGGTFEFRVAAPDEPTPFVFSNEQVKVFSDCNQENYQTGNPVHVSMQAGQYILLEPFSRADSSNSALPELSLSIY